MLKRIVNSLNPNRSLDFGLSPGRRATLACLLEATAPKPGNVHRGADFDDLSFVDLTTTAVALGAAIDAALARPAHERRVGRIALASVNAMNAICDRNAYLGTILLLSPLCLIPDGVATTEGVTNVLAELDQTDAADVYEAIRLAKPGGLGQADQHDVRGAPPDDLLVAMQAAAERDLVARQYTNGFAEVLGEVAPCLVDARNAGLSTTAAVIHAHVATIARHGDSLIARKCGPPVSIAAAARAQQVLDAGRPGTDDYHSALADFDFWLRSDGHRRNPGTTADLIAAALFVLLREDRLPPPWR